MEKIKFLEKARNLHGYKYEYLDLPQKIKVSDIIKVKFDGVVYYQKVLKHLNGRCPEKVLYKKTTEEYISECEKVWGDKYDYSLTKYEGALNNVKIIYNGIVYEQRAKSHLEGLSPEFRNNKESLLRDKINKSDLNGIKSIEEFFEKYKIDYEKNKNLDNNIFQFYLSSKRTVIEYLSKEHYLIKDLDKKKESYCEDNYIDLIKIRYDQFDDIYRILYENLKNYIKTKKTS
jgi:very-short-patch-repair endonuclease